MLSLLPLLTISGTTLAVIAIGAGIYLRSQLVITAAAAILLVTGAFNIGGRVARAECQEAAVQARLDAAEADLTAARNTAARAQAAEQTITAARDAANAQIAEYERALQGRDACALSPADVDALSRMRGGPGPR